MAGVAQEYLVGVSFCLVFMVNIMKEFIEDILDSVDARTPTAKKTIRSRTLRGGLVGKTGAKRGPVLSPVKITGPKALTKKQKVKKILLANVGKVVTREKVDQVIGNSHIMYKFIKELKEEGYNIQSKKENWELKSGQYILVSTKRTSKAKQAAAKVISKELRAQVLIRDGFICQLCGAQAGKPHPEDNTTKTNLRIDYIVKVVHGGSKHKNNLRALCMHCYEGAANISQTRPKLMGIIGVIRRATDDVQRGALQYLMTMYPDERPDDNSEVRAFVLRGAIRAGAGK